MNKMDDDAFVLKFLKEQTREELPDNGFTRRVMRHLPTYLGYAALYLLVSASSAAVFLMITQTLTMLY